MSFLAYLSSSISYPALSGPQALLLVVPLARLLERKGVKTKDKSAITFNGEPIQVVLARLNAKRNLPAGGKRAAKEGVRAKAKALMSKRAAESHQEQKAYEKAFWRYKRWSWRKVEMELRCRHLSFAAIATLAAEVGVTIVLAGDTLMKAAA